MRQLNASSKINITPLSSVILNLFRDPAAEINRDFIDLYFLVEEFSIELMLKFYDQEYKVLKEHLYSIIRSLDYFADAEKDKMPKMLKGVSWDKVKEFFQKQAIQLAKNKLKI